MKKKSKNKTFIKSSLYLSGHSFEDCVRDDKKAQQIFERDNFKNMNKFCKYYKK